MILVIDNYDSFVFNLARYFQRLGQSTDVVRNDAISVAEVRARKPQAVVLSPGPCTPNEAGLCLELIRELHRKVPLLGVCLGHQAIAAALGGRVVRGEPQHGLASPVHHEGTELFAGVPSPFEAARYHSLVVDESSLPDELQVTARTPDGTVMALEHRELPVFGVQFHPESILTPCGYPLLANFLRLAGLSATDPASLFGGELSETRPPQTPLPQQPITF